MNIVKEMIFQLFFVLMPFVMFSVLYRNKPRIYSQKFLNLSCMLCLFISMTFGTSVVNGYFYDIRYIIMLFGLIFGGLQTGFILVGEFVLYRLYLGGHGTWIGIVIIAITFPVSVLFSKLYQQSNRKFPVVLSAGLSFSVIPILCGYLINNTYILNNPTLHLVIIPVQNTLGSLILITLFRRAVVDKELFITYTQNEKARAISHVAASLVHEVRNPLTAVKGFLTLIRENSPDRERIERYIDICVSEVERTEYILSEYLSITKPMTDKQEPTDLLEILQITIDVMKPYANMNNVELETEQPREPIWILANPDKIKQILINFIKNAIEACTEASRGTGKVSLELWAAGGRVILKIEDNGVGMTVDQLNRLGSIYFSTKSTGTGLGLTFSYQAINSLGGTISVRSEPRAGTVFTINLPLYKKKLEQNGLNRKIGELSQ